MRERGTGNASVWLLLVFALLLAGDLAAVEVDGIAACVGSERILRSDVLAEMQRLGFNDGERYIEVRNEMIDRKLILKAATESKMTMQDWVVESRIREIINKNFEGDRNKLVEMLSQRKVSYPEWQAKTRDDMVIAAMRWNVVEKNVTASPAAMKAEYEGHPERYTRDHKVSVTVILLKPEERGRQNEVSEALKTSSFEDLGGRRYENVNPDELFKPEVVKEIAKMPKGTVSHWIEIDGWSFLLRKDGETVGTKLTFDEAYDEIEAAVKESAAKKIYLDWISRLRAETYIKVY